MSDTTNIINKRHPWLAVTLSLVMPGLGQVYCGRLKRGLILTFLNILPLPLIIWICHLSTASVVTQYTIGLIIAGGAIQLIALCDSAYLARKAGSNYQMKEYNSILVYLLLVLIVSGGSLGSALYLREKAFEAFRIPTASCYPTILPGDRVLANKSAYKTEDPKRGDLIVFLNPTNRHENYIKRVAAVAGDTVEIKDGNLYINDKVLQREKLPESILDTIKIDTNGKPLEGKIFEETIDDTSYRIMLSEMAADTKIADFEKTTVPEYHCFVLGDNRNLSRDSRHFGPVLLATVKGRADYIYSPAKDWSRFGKIGK